MYAFQLFIHMFKTLYGLTGVLLYFIVLGIVVCYQMFLDTHLRNATKCLLPPRISLKPYVVVKSTQKAISEFISGGWVYPLTVKWRAVSSHYSACRRQQPPPPHKLRRPVITQSLAELHLTSQQ